MTREQDGLLEELSRKSLSRTEILRRLRKAARDRIRADDLKAQADREIAQLTAVARARELVPMRDMTEAIEQSREFVYWLQREHGCTLADVVALEEAT